MTLLRFAAAYVDEQWITPCYVRLNPEGHLLAISEAAPEGMPVEEHSGYLIPGLSNGHSHSFQYVMAGMAEHLKLGREADDFWSWREAMYRVANSIDPDQLLEVSTQFYMALLEEGYTGVCEFHYLHHDKAGQPYADLTRMGGVLMEAARRAGIELTLTPVYYHQSSPGVPLRREQRRFYFADTDAYLLLLEQTSSLARDHYPEVQIGYGVHSLRAAPLGDIKTVLGTHWTLGPAHLHASEQAEDARIFEVSYRSRAIDWLYDNISLDTHHHLVHATHINDVEVKKLVATQATVVLCSTTEANLGDGIFPLPEFHMQGGSWAIGSDSQVNLSPFIEMRMPELVHRLLLEKRNILCKGQELDSGKLLFDRVLKGGRSSLGRSTRSFVIGQPFQGIVLDAEHDRLLARPLSQVLSILVFTGDRSLIAEVWSRGKKRVQQGRHRERALYRPGFERSMLQLMQELSGI
ncbi:MAG: amidohydrolase family protein [Oligoflexus sp.]|jgi:formimidoylglutamate deiminase